MAQLLAVRQCPVIPNGGVVIGGRIGIRGDGSLHFAGGKVHHRPRRWSSIPLDLDETGGTRDLGEAYIIEGIIATNAIAWASAWSAAPAAGGHQVRCGGAPLGAVPREAAGRAVIQRPIAVVRYGALVVDEIRLVTTQAALEKNE